MMITSTRLNLEQLASGMASKACSKCSISLVHLVGRTGFEPVTSSVSGNDIGRARFRIFFLSCCTWCTIVRWRPSLSAVIVTQLVTRLQALVGLAFRCELSARPRVG